jgi:hypothetical protein
MKMEESMKAIGSMIAGMGKVSNNIVMEISIKGNFKEEKLMALVFIIGKMESPMKVNGLMVLSMAEELGKVNILFLILIDTFGEMYSGEWKDNKANGKGEHVWSTGDRYVGDWMEFLKHGYGTDYFANMD